MWKGLKSLGVGTSPTTSPQNGLGAFGPDATVLANGQVVLADEEDDNGGPLWGLENYGNTCYANSVLQSLYYCQPFRDSILGYEVEGENTSPSAIAGPSVPKSIENGNQSELGKTIVPASLADHPESLFVTLHRLYSTIAAASADHRSAELAAAQNARNLTLGRGGKGLKAGKQTPARASTAPSPRATMTSPGVVTLPIGVGPGKRRDPGISAGPVDPAAVKSFLAAVRRENVIFNSTAHQDAHEFLNFTLNQIGEQLGAIDRASGKSGQQSLQTGSTQQNTIIHRLFEGILTNETRCLTCESVTSRDESFLDLSIDIEHNTSVTSCLRQFSASETLRSRNKFFCDSCSALQEAEKRMKIRKLPAVLALHLKRFKWEETTQRFVKLAYRVVFPLKIRLFNTSDDAEDPDRLYELYGIVVHIGAGPHQGHYVSIVKIGSKWAIFDDEAVHYIEQLDISKYFGDSPGTGSAYVLFYQAVDLDREKFGLPPDPAAVRKAVASSPVEVTVTQPSPSLGPVVTPGMASPGTALEAKTPPQKLQVQTTPSSAAAESATSSPMSPGGTSSGIFGRSKTPQKNNSLLQAAEASRAAADAAVSGTSKAGGWRPFSRSKDKQSKVKSPSAASESVPIPSRPHADSGSSHQTGLAGDEEDAASESTHTSSAGNDPVDPMPQGGHLQAPDRNEYGAAQVSAPVGQGQSGGEPVEERRTPTGPAPGIGLQGATFSPVQRALSRKDQQKIEKEARRRSSASVALSDDVAAALQQSQSASAKGGMVAQQPVPPPAGMTSSVSSGPLGLGSIGKGLPSSGDASKSAAPKRRSTLSRFGFGNKDKEKDKDKAKK